MVFPQIAPVPEDKKKTPKTVFPFALNEFP